MDDELPEDVPKDEEPIQDAHYNELLLEVGEHVVKNRGSLIDRGANGGIAGSDTRAVALTD